MNTGKKFLIGGGIVAAAVVAFFAFGKKKLTPEQMVTRDANDPSSPLYQIIRGDMAARGWTRPDQIAELLPQYIDWQIDRGNDKAWIQKYIHG